MSGWTAALDALEEWVRRTADGVTAAAPAVPSAPPTLPADALPPDLHLRAQLLMQAMRELEADVLRRREQLGRHQAYGAA